MNVWTILVDKYKTFLRIAQYLLIGFSYALSIARSIDHQLYLNFRIQLDYSLIEIGDNPGQSKLKLIGSKGIAFPDDEV